MSQHRRVSPTSSDFFVVHGADHSPWAQTVAIALRLKGLPFRTTFAFTPAKFLRTGFLVPTLFAGGLELNGSDSALRHLESLEGVGTPIKLSNVYEGEYIYKAEELFFNYVFGRITSFGSFVETWSRESEIGGTPSQKMLSAFLRSLAFYQFFSMLSWAAFAHKKKLDVGRVRDNLAWWAEQLKASGGPFLCGAEPTGVDAVLFGQIQCMSAATGSTGIALRQLEHEPELLAWCRRMNTAVDGTDGCEWLLSRSLESSDPARWGGADAASMAERVTFKAGLIFWGTVGLPVTVAAIAYHAAIRGKSPNRSLRTFIEVRKRRRAEKAAAEKAKLMH